MLIRRWCLAHNVALFMLKVIAADSGNSGLVTGEGVCGESSPCAKRQPGRNRYWQWRTTHAQVDKCGACERRERDPGGSRARVQLAGTTDRAVENGHCCSARRQQCIAPHCRQALSLSPVLLRTLLSLSRSLILAQTTHNSTISVGLCLSCLAGN